VLRSFNLDCNAIALDARTGLFLDAGAIKAVSQKRVDIVHGVIRHSQSTFAAKSVLLQIRLKYTLAGYLKHLVGSHLNCASLEHEVGKYFANVDLIAGAVYESSKKDPDSPVEPTSGAGGLKLNIMQSRNPIKFVNHHRANALRIG
jgi:hypothetical protein